MKQKSTLILFFGIACSVILLAACSQVETPTATSVPSATSEPNTAIPEPTATIEPTATPERPYRILFIGDSFTNYNLGIDQHMIGLAASANPTKTIETASVAGDNMTLYYQWKLGQALKAIQEGNWDVVVLQEDIGMPEYDKQEFYEYVRMFDEEIKKVGAQTVLYMHWEWKRTGKPQLAFDEIAQDYSEIGTELGAIVAPVGLAWQKSIQERPDLNLYETDLTSHANIQGTYLTICVLYATIFGESPVGLTYYPADMIAGNDIMKLRWEEWQQMTEDEMSFLQQIAWETVSEYRAHQ
jgi:hypothetical protein